MPIRMPTRMPIRMPTRMPIRMPTRFYINAANLDYSITLFA